MSIKFKWQILEEWLIVIGIMFTHYIEAAILLLVCMQIIRRTKKAMLSIKIVMSLLMVSMISMSVITVVGYSYGKYFQQLVLISYFFVAYYIIFESYKNNLQSLFDKYVAVIYVLSILGLIQFVVFAATGVNIFVSFTHLTITEAATVAPRIMRLHSLFTEPSGFSTLATPAAIYLLMRDNLDTKYKRIRNVIIISTVLCFSSVTTLIIALSIPFKFIVIRKNKKIKLAVLILTVIFSTYTLLSFRAFEVSSNDSDKGLFYEINQKLSETFNGLSELDPTALELLNLSSYASLSNLWVASNAPSRLFGTGLGTHEQNYFSLYKSDYEFYGLNAQEAYSLLTRVFSEFGFVGVVLMFLFLFKNFSGKSLINVSVLFILITLLLRGGHYVRNGGVFFFFLYYYTALKKQHNETNSAE